MSVEEKVSADWQFWAATEALGLPVHRLRQTALHQLHSIHVQNWKCKTFYFYNESLNSAEAECSGSFACHRIFQALDLRFTFFHFSIKCHVTWLALMHSEFVFLFSCCLTKYWEACSSQLVTNNFYIDMQCTYPKECYSVSPPVFGYNITWKNYFKHSPLRDVILRFPMY